MTKYVRWYLLLSVLGAVVLWRWDRPPVVPEARVTWDRGQPDEDGSIIIPCGPMDGCDQPVDDYFSW